MSCNSGNTKMGQMGGVYNGPHFAPTQSGGSIISKLLGGTTVEKQAQSAQSTQSGGSRRRKHSTRRRRSSGSRKTRSRGCKRACRCPGGCKRSTCPCCKGSKNCCTKRCRSHGCRCKH